MTSETEPHAGAGATPARPSGGTTRRVFLGAVIAGTGLILAGCAREPGAPATASPTRTPSKPPAPARFPLTGLPVSGDSVNHPALSAKIGNDVEARPQWGLGRADIVYETLVEGGLTRYAAVWHSDIPDRIGPLRSIRPMDPAILSPYGGIVAYSGGQEQFLAQMRGTGLYNAIHGQPDTDRVMRRVSSRPAPHNVEMRAAEFVTAHEDLLPPTRGFEFAEDAAGASATAGEPVERIAATFSSFRRQAWDWDAASGRFLRRQQGEVDVAESGDTSREVAQIAAVNVLVLRVEIDHRYEGVPMTVLTGSGEARVASGGRILSATWRKRGDADPLTLHGPEGVPILLAPGNTWVELLPLIDGASLEAE